MTVRQINFDMDGTIANLYGVENWLEMLTNKDATPYRIAKPLLNMNVLARYLNRLLKEGYEVNIISWLAKNSNSEYDEQVKIAKLAWLKAHLHSVNFTNIFIVEYGTYKENLGKGILFDDEENNRKYWKGEAYDEKNILEILKKVLDNSTEMC